MDKTKVVQLLYAEFGDKEFLTRQISEETMAHLVKQIGITETDIHRRNTLLGKSIGSLDGATYSLESSCRVKVEVERPEGRHLPRRFRLVREPVKLDKVALSIGDLAGLEIPERGLTYQVVLIDSGCGYAVFCPALRGCGSQGLDKEEALENIREAIIGWLKLEALDIEQRTQALLDDYNSGGYPAELATVSIGKKGA